MSDKKIKRTVRTIQRLTGRSYSACLMHFRAKGSCPAIEYERDRWKFLSPEARKKQKENYTGMSFETFEEMRAWRG